MKKINILTIAMLLLIHGVVTAQNQQQYRSLSDPLVVRYISGGHAAGGKMYLVASEDYWNLNVHQRREIMEQVSEVFPEYDIQVHLGGQDRELWVSHDGELFYVGQWDNDSLQLADYRNLELKRHGDTKFFYYIGGMMGGDRQNSNGNLALRGGSYLYKKILDVSVTLNLGFNSTGRRIQFASDLSTASRVHLPLQIKNIRLAPNFGAGLSWVMAPSSFFEFQLLAGTSWFVGTGSMDFGVQYGTQRGFSFSIGYTFN